MYNKIHGNLETITGNILSWIVSWKISIINLQQKESFSSSVHDIHKYYEKHRAHVSHCTKWGDCYMRERCEKLKVWLAFNKADDFQNICEQHISYSYFYFLIPLTWFYTMITILSSSILQNVTVCCVAHLISIFLCNMWDFSAPSNCWTGNFV